LIQGNPGETGIFGATATTITHSSVYYRFLLH
jgi:hypothetical protein